MEMKGFVFDFGWKKSIDFQFEENMRIECVFSAFEGERLSPEQEAAFAEFEKNKARYEKTSVEIFAKYAQKERLAHASAAPTALFFKRDGSFGLLLECSWEPEHGAVIVLYPEQWVGTQDMFL